MTTTDSGGAGASFVSSSVSVFWRITQPSVSLYQTETRRCITSSGTVGSGELLDFVFDLSLVDDFSFPAFFSFFSFVDFFTAFAAFKVPSLFVGVDDTWGVDFDPAGARRSTVALGSTEEVTCTRARASASLSFHRAKKNSTHRSFHSFLLLLARNGV